MHDADHKLVYLLWAVIVVLVIGAGIGGFLMYNHVNDVEQTNTELNGNNASLKRQVEQLRATPTPSPTPEPSYVGPPITPTPAPKATPKH